MLSCTEFGLSVENTRHNLSSPHQELTAITQKQDRLRGWYLLLCSDGQRHPRFLRNRSGKDDVKLRPDGHIGIGWAEKAAGDKSIPKEKENIQALPEREREHSGFVVLGRKVMVRFKAGEVGRGLIRKTFWEFRLYPDGNFIVKL